MANRYKKAKRNTDQAKPKEHVVLRALKHSYVWGGVGMILRGGYFGPLWNPALGMISLAYGIYDVLKDKDKPYETKNIVDFLPSEGATGDEAISFFDQGEDLE